MLSVLIIVGTTGLGEYNPMGYNHTQKAPVHFLLHFIGVSLLIVTWRLHNEWSAGLSLGMVAAALGFVALGLMFAHLTVRDEGEHLAIRYGALPAFGRRIRYSDISAVKPSRSLLIDGFGIHWIPGRGLTMNLWGFDCVEIMLGNRVLRLGSDDVDNLTAFLRTKIRHT